MTLISSTLIIILTGLVLFLARCFQFYLGYFVLLTRLFANVLRDGQVKKDAEEKEKRKNNVVECR